MVENLLCRSSVVARTVAAAIDVIGGLGVTERGSCHPARKVPFRILHGDSDTVLLFDKQCEVDGATFMATSECFGGGRQAGCLGSGWGVG